jgi:hypothetical protein
MSKDRAGAGHGWISRGETNLMMRARASASNGHANGHQSAGAARLRAFRAQAHRVTVKAMQRASLRRVARVWAVFATLRGSPGVPRTPRISPARVAAAAAAAAAGPQTTPRSPPSGTRARASPSRARPRPRTDLDHRAHDRLRLQRDLRRLQRPHDRRRQRLDREPNNLPVALPDHYIGKSRQPLSTTAAARRPRQRLRPRRRRADGDRGRPADPRRRLADHAEGRVL